MSSVIFLFHKGKQRKVIRMLSEPDVNGKDVKFSILAEQRVLSEILIKLIPSLHFLKICPKK